MQTPKKKQQEGGSFLESVPELQDEARMRYLFSNFPLQRESNPKKWDDLRTFWTTIIYPITYHPSKKVKLVANNITYYAIFLILCISQLNNNV